MKRCLVVFVLICCLRFPLLAQTKVVLKLDDIGAQNSQCKSLPVMEYLIKRKVKASYGVIANKLDGSAKPLLHHVLTAKDGQGRPMVEVWNHGLDHSKIGDVFEFKNSSYAMQRLHLDSAHLLVKKFLDIDMITFGAPFNATDTVCLRAIHDNGNYTKVFYSRVSVSFSPNFERINNAVAMEKETGKPDFEFFKKDYDKHPEYRSANIVLQGHPPYWTEEGFTEFKKILDFLDSQQVEYILPSAL